MSKVKLHLLTEVGCLLCDTLYDQSRANAGFTTCFECGVMLSKFARTERARFYDLNPTCTPKGVQNNEEQQP